MIYNSYLVTGGAGFIGRNLVERLANLRAKVFILDLLDLYPSYSGLQPERAAKRIRGVYAGTNRNCFSINTIYQKTTYIKADICDFEKINSVIKKYKIDCIFHLAAQALVEKAYKDPKTTLTTNIIGTVNILESARVNPHVKAVIVASSDKAYGKQLEETCEHGKISEARIFAQQEDVIDRKKRLESTRNNRYSNVKSTTNNNSGANKLHKHDLVSSKYELLRIAQQENFPCEQQHLRIKIKEKYSEKDPLCGDHPYEVSKSCADLIAQTYHKTYNLPVTITRFGNVYGEGDLNFNRIIPGIMEAIIKHKTFEIRSNGRYVRDYVYVKDVVRGYLMLAKNINKIKGEAFNFGGRDSYSVLELIKLIELNLHKKLKYKILNTAQNEIPYQSLDFSKIRKTLGWKPKYSFETTISKIFRYYQKYFTASLSL